MFAAIARRYFGKDAELWLFGSRVDDRKKGGDYDFFVETSISNADEIIERKIALLAELQDTLGRRMEEISGCPQCLGARISRRS